MLNITNAVHADGNGECQKKKLKKTLVTNSHIIYVPVNVCVGCGAHILWFSCGGRSYLLATTGEQICT